ncbi:MAG: stage III sporulation protein AB [Clostridia bacterium]|nr:stage III sporulation protein AB [Clostridia bacterium]
MAMELAMTAMLGVGAAGMMLADGERRRIRYVQAMRRCLLRMHEIIRFEQPELTGLLRRIDMRTTREERELTRILHACADRLANCVSPRLALLYAGESAKIPGYGVLSEEDREAFEWILSGLGACGLGEQLRMIDEADERLRRREAALDQESAQRARMIRTLGLSGGAALFLILI